MRGGSEGSTRAGRFGAWVVLAAVSAAGGCAGKSSSDTRGAARAACFPPCLANLVKRCPLTGACQADLEPNPAVKALGESNGVATCFASGEKERTATNDSDLDVVYVKDPAGKECYEVVGSGTPGVEVFDVSVGGQLVGVLS